jgi:tetratricopeptide (TPR) repeat protein
MMHIATGSSPQFRRGSSLSQRKPGRACRRPFFCCLLVVALFPTTAATTSGQERHVLETAAGRKALIDTIATLVENRFVLAERAPAFADSLRARETAGSYDSLTTPAAFAEAVTADLREITGDSHFLLRVVEPSDVGEQAQSPLHHPIRLFRLSQREHLGFASLEWMEGDIGYLDLRRFYPISESKQMVDGAMRFLAGADAVIIDLRENGGGAGESLPYLTRYFLPYPTQLTSYYSRESDFLTEFWTAKEVGAARLPDVPLFLLTSERTFSAAEMFAYDLKVRGRATLVGSATGGGAHSVDLFPLDGGFEIYISTARAINPVTNGNWEGTGVIPDVAVPADVALDTALVLARSAAREYREPKDASLAAAVQKMERALAGAETAFRDGRTADGEMALFGLVEAGADHGLINEFFLSVLAYNYSPETDAALLVAILRKRVELFPRSADAYEALGTTLATIGEGPLARTYFLRALELDPDNRNVRRKLNMLENH